MAISSYQDENVFQTIWELFPGLIKFVGVVAIIVVGFVSFNLFGLTNNNQLLGDYQFKDGTGIIHDFNPKEGNKDSNIKVVIIEDLQCPNCQLYHQALETVKPEFLEKVQFIHKQFPITTAHQYAEIAGQSAYAAAKQNKFFEYIDLDFTNQSELNTDKLTEWAQQLNLNVDQFKSDRSSDEIKKQMAWDTEDVNRIKLPNTTNSPADGNGKINGTPTTIVFVNDTVSDWWSGTISADELRTRLQLITQ